MRLYPDTRERSNRSTAPTATTVAPGKPPAPETPPGPGRHCQSRHHTNYTTTPTIHHAPHRRALRNRAMHCRTTTRPSKKLQDHRRCSSGTRNAACAAQPAETTPNSEPAGTKVAIGSPNSANGHGGASERRCPRWHLHTSDSKRDEATSGKDQGSLVSDCLYMPNHCVSW